MDRQRAAVRLERRRRVLRAVGVPDHRHPDRRARQRALLHEFLRAPHAADLPAVLPGRLPGARDPADAAAPARSAGRPVPDSAEARRIGSISPTSRWPIAAWCTACSTSPGRSRSKNSSTWCGRSSCSCVRRSGCGSSARRSSSPSRSRATSRSTAAPTPPRSTC